MTLLDVAYADDLTTLTRAESYEDLAQLGSTNLQVVGESFAGLGLRLNINRTVNLVCDPDALTQ